MDIKSINGVVHIKNIGYGRIVSQAFSIAHEGEVILDTRRQQERVLKDLQFFLDKGDIDVEIIGEQKPKQGTVNVEKVVTEHGVEHTIFKPSDRLINVEEIDTSGKSVNLGFSKIDAIDLLAKHWKSLEKEVAETKDINKIKMLLSVAKEQELTGRKLEIIQYRLQELK